MSKNNVCPWWIGYLLLSPLRQLRQNPHVILKPYVREGMYVIDYGCAMGYFSLPLARMVGDDGKVYCMDIQKKMLQQLIARAEKADLANRIKPLLLSAEKEAPTMESPADFALLFAVVHEVPDPEKLFAYLAAQLKPKAKVLFAEPKGHVGIEQFKASIRIATSCGFIQRETLYVWKSHAVVLEKE